MPESLFYDKFSSPLGKLTLVASSRGLRAVLWENEPPHRVRLEGEWKKAADFSLLAETKKQLTEFFEGRRTQFTLSLDPVGSAFQKRAWAELGEIPYGTTVSYREQARRLGDPRLARAVGAANGKNPISIVVPCHRVVGSDGKLTGFAGGLRAKQFLLSLERNAREL